MRNKWLTSWGQNHWQNSLNDTELDQFKCVFQPNISDNLADSILENLELEPFNRVGISNEMIIDAFKLFYSKDKTVALKPNMYWFHHFLSKCDNHILSLVTNGNTGFSFIAANAVVDVLRQYLSKENPDTDDMNSCISNGTIDDNGDMKTLQAAAKRAFTKAKNDINKIKQSAKKLGCSKDFGKDLETAKIIADPKLLNVLNVNGNQLAKFAQIVIDKAVSYNTGKRYTVEESIFESEDIEEIANMENFAHIGLLHDLSVIENKYSMNFDVFIDDSGSMGSSHTLGGKRIELRVMARMIAFKMYQLGLVKDIWLFSAYDELFKIDIGELFSSRIDGGTDISQCIKQANKSGRPCLIITDGSDSLEDTLRYNPDVYMLCLEMSWLNYTFKEYADNGQILFYDEYDGFRMGKFNEDKYQGDIRPE